MRRKASNDAGKDQTPGREQTGKKNAETPPSRPTRAREPVAATDLNGDRRRRGRSCLICSLPSSQRERIDRGLVLGELTDSEVARQVGLHRANVGRHRKRHLLEPLATQVVETVEEFNLPGEMRKLYGKVVAQLEKAEQSANVFAVRAFLAEARAAVETLLKLELAAAAAAPKTPVTIEIDVSAGDAAALDVTGSPRQGLLVARPVEAAPDVADEEVF